MLNNSGSTPDRLVMRRWGSGRRPWKDKLRLGSSIALADEGHIWL
jgi:hypothetical protein